MIINYKLHDHIHYYDLVILWPFFDHKTQANTEATVVR
jgi:hypothetical protein